jgi:hypothetical protein
VQVPPPLQDERAASVDQTIGQPEQPTAMTATRPSHDQFPPAHSQHRPHDMAATIARRDRDGADMHGRRRDHQITRPKLGWFERVRWLERTDADREVTVVRSEAGC